MAKKILPFIIVGATVVGGAIALALAKKKEEAVKDIKCEYCGSKNKAGTTKCKSCGANL